MDVGPVKALQENLRCLPVKQFLDDLVAGFGIGGGGKGGKRHVERAAQLADAQIIRAEIMAPLAYAMGLIDGDEAHTDAAQHAKR